MTAPNLLDELEKIVALSKTATPGPWEVVTEAVNPYWRADGTEVNSESGRIANCHADGLRVLENCQANAAIIAISVNFLRTHAPALADMAKRMEAAERDSKRLRNAKTATVEFDETIDGEHVGGIPFPHSAVGRKYRLVRIDATQEGEG